MPHRGEGRAELGHSYTPVEDVEDSRRATLPRIKLTLEKEALIRQLHAEGKPVAAIARIVGLTRKTVYAAIR
jgi:DNA invertase Pin-like site-specific DNA recombinase